jgi:hypothetical protein
MNKPLKNIPAFFSIAMSLAFPCAHASDTPSVPKPQQACLPETDAASPRKSRLKSSSPDNEIIRLDITGNGKPDVLERWLNGKRARWLDENNDMKWTDSRGDLIGDALQIDMDGDGYYDGPADMNVKWTNDGIRGKNSADAVIVTINPNPKQTGMWAGSSHYMVFIDTDKDGVNEYIDWEKFSLACWRTTGDGNYSPDYNGDSIFLKQHLPAWVLTDARYNWENPFAFYDTDDDGCTEMTVRIIDTHHATPDSTPEKPLYYNMKKANEAYVSYDLDNDSGKDNEFDLDMTLRFFTDDRHPGERMPYSHFADRHPNMPAPKWVLDGGYFRHDNWRRIDHFIYIPHQLCHDQVFAHREKWGACWLVFDEDDDDHRWERVELYWPTTNPYALKRARNVITETDRGLSRHPQADSLGDRGEWDEDNSGKGKLYIGAWDRKIHLHGAESGAWTVDRERKYWGAGPVVVGGSSGENATKVEELVQYADTDGNGYFDRITYDYDGDGTVDLVINLLDYKTADNPHPDIQSLHDPAGLEWKGMHELYKSISKQVFQEGHAYYRAAWRKDLTDKELDDLAIASSTGEKYNNGYWLKEKIFRKLDRRLASDPASQKELRRAHFTGDVDGVVRVIEALK